MATITAITMPKWGMEMSEGTINEWRHAVGDTVTAGTELVDVETSKIVNTVTAPAAGVLRRTLAQPGEILPVGALLGVLADADTSEAEIDQFIAAKGGASAPAAPSEPAPAAAEKTAAVAAPAAAKATEKPAPAADTASVTPIRPKTAPGALDKLAEGGDDSTVAATPVARRLAQQYGVNLHNVTATGRHQRVTKADLEEAVLAAGGNLLPSSSAPPRQPTERDDSDVRATPVARRLARELGINLYDCRASGNRGRVSKADVEAAAALLQRSAAAPAASGTLAAEPAFEETPLSGMRKTIAARLQQSKQTAPHFRVNVDAEIDALLAVRKQLNAANSNAKISVNDFIIKACASALMRVPEVNVQFENDGLKRFRHADISVAVALPEGLITPIVKQADTKGLVAISNEVRDLSTRAKLGTLSPDEFQGGTFTISNLGMFGVKQFDAIINPPQCAILAVGAGEQRPVVRDGQLAVATVVTLSLASDHRIIDGALAAKFMAALKGFLEQPATMLG